MDHSRVRQVKFSKGFNHVLQICYTLTIHPPSYILTLSCYLRPPRRGTGSTCRLSENRCTGTSAMAYEWPRVSHLSWAFVLLHFSPATNFFFACVSLHIPVHPFSLALPSIPCTSRLVPHFPSQNPLEHARSRFLLQRTSFYVPLFFPPAFRYSVLPFVPSHTFHVCSALHLPKSSWASPLEVPLPAYFLPSPTLPFFYCEWHAFFFTLFSWNFFFFFLKNLFVPWIYCISCNCLHFCYHFDWFF